MRNYIGVLPFSSAVLGVVPSASPASFEDHLADADLEQFLRPCARVILLEEIDHVGYSRSANVVDIQGLDSSGEVEDRHIAKQVDKGAVSKLNSQSVSKVHAVR